MVSRDCDWTETDDGVRCRQCGKVQKRATRRNCPRRGPPTPHGPGTELTKIIEGWQKMFPWFDLSPGQGCNCKKIARWMDWIGVDGCEKQIEVIIDKLAEEAKKRKLTVPFQRFWAKRMVKQAIRRARKLSQGGT